MSQQPQPDPEQRLNTTDTLIQDSQIGQAGRDLTQNKVTKITLVDFGGVANLVDRIVSRFIDRQASTIVRPLTQQEYRQRKVLFNRVKKFWIEDVLENSLHTKAMIALGLEERFKAVKRPFSSIQESSDAPGRALPVGTDITQVFNQMGDGKPY